MNTSEALQAALEALGDDPLEDLECADQAISLATRALVAWRDEPDIRDALCHLVEGWKLITSHLMDEKMRRPLGGVQ